MKKILLASFILLSFLFLACNDTEVSEGPDYSPLATCLAEEGAEFYGAYWCPACKKQKEYFGEAAPLLPYVECDPQGENEQSDLCQELQIQKYPTWFLPDGTRQEVIFTPEQLSEITGCPLSTEDQSILYQ